MAAWEVPLGIALTVLGGMALAVQAGTNASLGTHVTKPVAAIISFGLGLAACAIYLLVDATAISKQLPAAADFQGAPWWAWIGGALGAYYVVINITFAYRLGAGTAVAVFVCSQLCTSIVLDLTGLVGFQKRAFSWPRITGAALMLMGVMLVTQFPGNVIAAPKPQQQQQQQPQDPEAQQQQAAAQEQQQQQQQQQQLKQLKQAGSLQAASAASLLPTAADVSLGSTSSASTSSHSGSAGSALELGPLGSAGSSSSRALRGMSAVWAGGSAQHVQHRPCHHNHQQQQQQEGCADIDVRVQDH